MKKNKGQHSKETDRWGTPADTIRRERLVMGGIDCDPCSEAFFNEVVQASTFYDKLGLLLPWEGRLHVNPPGGCVAEFWRRLTVGDEDTACVEQAIWIGFSLEQLALLADEHCHPLDFSYCIPRQRLDFVRHDGYQASPSHSNYIVGIGTSHEKFWDAFKDLGKVFYGKRVLPTGHVPSPDEFRRVVA